MTPIPADVLDRLRACKVVPVITIEKVEHAVPLAAALVNGGIDVLEITLRTDCALDAISAISKAGLGAFVGAGTITRPEDISRACDAGAEFLVTPGTPYSLLHSLKAFEGVVFPGIATVTEALNLRAEGFSVQKFFPAEASGGAAMLKSIAAPIPDLTFMPTGGITVETASEYLKLPNVIAVGGSWLCKSYDIENLNWSGITHLARQASAL